MKRMFVLGTADFFEAVHALCEGAAEGSVWFTFKQISDKKYRRAVKSATGQEPKATGGTRCFIRVTDGSKKVATAIFQRDVIHFMERLGSTFRDKFSGLRGHVKGKRAPRAESK